MIETQAPAKKQSPDQTVRNAYSTIPARSSAGTTGEQSSSRSYAGHQAGVHPEDMPRTTASKAAIRSVPDDMDNDALYPQPLPSSTRRYRPQPGRRTDYRPPDHRKAFYTLIVGSSVVAGILIALLVPPLWQRSSDQIHYGFPRTWQMDANVGHGTARNPDSHFIALNNHGYVEVIEIPEGVPGKNELPQLYLVAKPDNAAADQAPVTLTFADVNGDGKTDMIVHCDGNEAILYNNGHTFKQTP